MREAHASRPADSSRLVARLRCALIRLVACALGSRNKQPIISLPRAPRILVIRLDERLGNRLLLTPLLASLRGRFASGHLDLLAHRGGAALFADDATRFGYEPFDKRALLSSCGPLAVVWRLRRRRYDLCIDAGNPTDPSVTQAIVAAFVGARFTVGPDVQPFASLYTHPAPIIASGPHEIVMRLALLQPVPGSYVTDVPALSPPSPASDAPIRTWWARNGAPRGAVLFVGARLAAKKLGEADYVALAAALAARRLTPVIAWGERDAALAHAVAARVTGSLLAPPTDAVALAWLMSQATCVISCDTGPMHLACALGRPTCALFVSTDPARYGPRHAPHRVVDLRRTARADWMVQVESFIAEQLSRA